MTASRDEEVYVPKVNLFRWTSEEWWKAFVLKDKSDMINAFGGDEGILKHTWSKAINCINGVWLFWVKVSTFEENMKYKKLANMQKSVMSQIPKWRFILEFCY